MRFLRIAHSESSCSWGEQQQRILSEAIALEQTGHQILIVCPEESPLFSAAQNNGLQTIPLPIRTISLQGLLSSREFLKYNQIDIINTHSRTDSWLFTLASKLLKKSPTLIRTYHNTKNISSNWRNRWINKQAKYIICTDKIIRQQLIQTLQLKTNKIITVATAINNEYFYPPSPTQKYKARKNLAISDENIHIVITEILKKSKGHEDLLVALSEINLPNLKLSIVGDGPEYDRLAAMIQVLRLGEMVQLVGYQEDITQWLHAADIFVLPIYANEGIPQSLMQAMSCSLPCVTTDIGAIPEIALEHQTALLVSPRQPQELAAAIRTLIYDLDLRKQLGVNANKLITEKYSYVEMISKIEQIYYDAIK